MPPAGPTIVAVNETLDSLYAPVARELAAVEALLAHELASEHPKVDKIIRHGLRLGGKRLRPALLLLTAKAVGPISDAHVTLAAVVEIIHTATLIHDDVLDDASIRRHADTVNARFGNQKSILLGDLLFTHAFYLASTLDSTYACRTIGRATNIVCDGELRQTVSSGDFSLSEKDYHAIIEAKTAELCACCCQLGAHYAGADTRLAERLADFGRFLGVAFQIADDLLDLEGSEQATGKSLGSDWAHKKMTLPLIHARDVLTSAGDRNGEGHAFEQLLTAEGDNRRPLAAWLERCGSLEYARNEAFRHAELAAECLADLPESSAKDRLLALPRLAVMRDR